MICYVFKPKGSRVYRGRYRINGGKKIYEVALKTHIKEVAEERLKQLISDLDRESVGIIAPKALREGAKKPVSEHCVDFLASITERNRTEDHIKHVRGRLKKLCKDCRWYTLRDITPESFAAWRSRQKALSSKTLNEYLGHANALVNWMVRQGRASINPLKAVHNLEVKVTFHRRALSMDELMRLVKGSGKRGLAYLFAACTGLRRGEIKQVRWTDIHLDTPKPYIDVRAETTKSQKPAILPLVPMLAEALRTAKVRGEKHFSGLVFKGRVPEVKRLSKDLVACGIPVEDDRGFRVDFHAFRHTFASLLATAGVTYASDEPVGAVRALENLRESAFHSQHYAGFCAASLRAIFVLTLVGSIVLLLLSALNFAATPAGIAAARCVSASLLFMLSVGTIRGWLGYSRFSRKAEHIDAEASRLLERGTPDARDAQRLLGEYQLARASAPLIPTCVWQLRRKRLNEIWAGRITTN